MFYCMFILLVIAPLVLGYADRVESYRSLMSVESVLLCDDVLLQGDFDKALHHYKVARRLASGHDDVTLINANLAKLDAASATTASRTINAHHHQPQQQQQQPRRSGITILPTNERCRHSHSLHRHPHQLSSPLVDVSGYFCVTCDYFANTSRLNRR